LGQKHGTRTITRCSLVWDFFFPSNSDPRSICS
jgi:hypothetical protein